MTSLECSRVPFAATGSPNCRVQSGIPRLPLWRWMRGTQCSALSPAHVAERTSRDGNKNGISTVLLYTQTTASNLIPKKPISAWWLWPWLWLCFRGGFPLDLSPPLVHLASEPVPKPEYRLSNLLDALLGPFLIGIPISVGIPILRRFRGLRWRGRARGALRWHSRFADVSRDRVHGEGLCWLKCRRGSWERGRRR